VHGHRILGGCLRFAYDYNVRDNQQDGSRGKRSVAFGGTHTHTRVLTTYNMYMIYDVRVMTQVHVKQIHTHTHIIRTLYWV